MRRYLVPTLTGALVAAAVRGFAGSGVVVAAIGAVVVIAVVAALALIGRWLQWDDAPVLYAAVASIAATVAFLVTRAPQ